MGTHLFLSLPLGDMEHGTAILCSQQIGPIVLGPDPAFRWLLVPVRYPPVGWNGRRPGRLSVSRL